jgi:ABC-type sulfate transport system permease component
VLGRTQTLPLLVYAEFQAGLEAALPAAVILVVTAIVVLVGVRLIAARPIGELRSLG